MVISDSTNTKNNATVNSDNIPESKKAKVLLIGCGNAVHVLLAAMTGQSYHDNSDVFEFTVNILSTHADNLIDSLPEDGRIQCTSDTGEVLYGKANIISKDAAEVDIPNCIVILFALPTDRHEVYLKSMKPYIREGTMIGSMPGEGGFDLCIRNVLGADLTKKCTLFSLETLPWACRINSFGKAVQILGTKKDIDLCVIPSSQFTQVQEILQAMMIGIHPIVKGDSNSTFLGVSLMNPNALAHPCIEYGLLRNWDGVTPFDKPPLFYQAIDDYTANLLTDLSNEILDIKSAIQESYPNANLELVRTLHDFFEEAYAEDIADHSTLRTMFVTNKGYDGLAMPTKTTESGGYIPLFNHRYFTEDLPCGILVQKGIAELVDVSTPVMDKIIKWCQERVGKEYLINGKLTGKDLASTKTPQRYGYTDLKTFMEANEYA